MAINKQKISNNQTQQRVGKMNSKFSIVIPLYNKAKSILTTLESVSQQTYKNYELIIVDDGSTDGGAELVHSKMGTSVKLFRQANQGVSIARNRGVSEATGDIIAFLDTDDIWEPHYLEEMALMVEKFPMAGCFTSAYQLLLEGNQYVDPKIRFSGPLKEPKLLDDYFEVSAKGDLPFMMSSFCVRRSAFVAVGGFPKGVPVGEDQDLYVRLALAGSIAYNPSVLSFYHLNASNRACESIVPDEECSFSKKVYEYAQDDKLPISLRKQMIDYCAAHILHLVSLNIKLGRILVAKRLLRDERCLRHPLRYCWWSFRCLLKI
jgi:glycosyltransferase involved in cell wall biosynthesis